MNSWIESYKQKLLQFWQTLEKRQKIMLIATIVFLISSLSIYAILASKPKYELAFVGLNEKEAGNVVAKLDEMGIIYQLSSDGRNISVPESQAAKVKVTMAQELDNGSIYNKFLDNSTWGMTDAQFKLIEKGAIEQEIRNLIVEGIRGINDANVMITLPQESVFYSEEDKKATASVIVDLEPGTTLNPQQVQSMYKLISRSVPNLPVENITITNQYSELLEYIDEQSSNFNGNAYNSQREIQKEFQQDIKNELQQMLGNMLGSDKVVVTVFAKLNFDQKKETFNLVEPVVDDKGIAISVEKIQESFSGSGNPAGGVAGTGNTQIPGYQAGGDSSGDYEHLEDRVNYEVNRISKEVISSPYRLDDLSINVVVDLDDQDPKSAQTTEAIKELIKPIVLTALNDQALEESSLDQKIAVIAHTFERKDIGINGSTGNGMSPLMYYGLIGLAVLAIGGTGYGVISRKRKKQQQLLEELELANAKEEQRIIPEFDLTPTLTEEAALRKEIQKMAKQKPDEFAKLVRTWLVDE